MSFLWKPKQKSPSHCGFSINTSQCNAISAFLKINIAAFVVCVLTVGSASAQSDFSNISLDALNQIQALLTEKAQRTPSQKKISSHLLHVKNMRLGRPVAKGIQKLFNGVKIHTGETTDIFIRADVSPSVIGQITAMGGSNIQSYPKHRAIHARVPLSQLESLALLPQVQFIRPGDHAITNSHPLPDVSEGDHAHRSDLVRSTFGVDGTGVKVGVMSDGVDNLSHLQGSGDLPTNVTVLAGQAGSGSEGTAMLEIVHDLAPGADLLFATAFNTQEQFANNILALRDAGADIIVDDVFYFAETPFIDGTVAQAVNDVTASGVLFFSSAGNSGNVNDNRAGVWEGDFKEMDIPVAISHATLNSGDKAHDFGGGTATNKITDDPPNWVILWWSDLPGASTNDYDLFVLDSSGTSVLSASTSNQTGSQDPLEFIDSRLINHLNMRLMVVRNNGAQDRYLHLNTHRGELDIATNGQTLGHAAAAEAFGVAAVNVATAGGGDFIGGASNPVETFSSDGPRRIFYHADGSEVTPGNLSASGGLVRQKPDIAAADGVTTSTPGFKPFFGTSAAAPHAAAIAALVNSANLSLSNAQIRTALESTALDIEAPGVDQDSGHGLLDAFAAVQSVNPTVQRELTVTLNGNGTGSVISNVGSINCPGVCSHSYDLNTVVTLSATPDSGFLFTGWSGVGCGGTGTCVVTMDQLQTVTATFQGSQSLSVIFAGTGTGSVTDNEEVTCVANCVAFYDYGVSVILQASVDIGSIFTGWSGAGCSGTGDCVLTMDQAQTVTATFSPEGGSEPLTVTHLTVGSGRTYQVIPDGLQVGATVYIDRSFTFSTIPGSLQGATYIQTANADKSSQGPSFFSFDVNQPVTVYVGHDQRITDTPFWLNSFALTGQTWVSSDTTFTVYTQTFPTGTIILGGNHETATGKSMYTIAVVSNGPPPPPPSYSLTVTMAGSGNGQVTSDVGTIDCPASNCADTYPDQTVVTLDAGASVGTIFTGWSGAGCSGLLSCVVTMNQAHSVTAAFELEHILTVQLVGPGSGTVTSDLGSINCPTSCQDSYGQGTTVMLTAVPNPTMEFTGWNGAGCSGTGPCLVTLLQAETVTATFATDTTGPTVTINQAAGQADPTNTSSINFTVVFSEIVTDFATGDVTLGGTAGATTATVTGSGLTYNVAVSGMATDGTVTASLAAGVATDSLDNANSASTSTDNEVTFATASAPLSVTNLSVGSGRLYQVIPDGLQVGATVYIDRSFTFSTIPGSLQGATYIQTANADKNSQGSSFFSFNVNQPVTVYVGHDQRITDTPSWVSAFALTGETWASSDTAFTVYTQTFPAGTVILGGNHETATGKSMYTIAVVSNGPPPPGAFNLTVVLSGMGSGTVGSNLGSLNCPGTCSESYSADMVVTLTADPDPGSFFTGWSGAGCSGPGDCVVTMDQARSVTATFEGLQTLTVTMAGTGSGTVADGGLLACPTNCTADYDYNASVTLQASADPGSVFTGWSGASCSGTGDCVLTMSQARAVTATFGLEGGGGALAITNVTVGSGQTYQVVLDSLEGGSIVYVDRSYTYTTVPVALGGATYIQTANNDKNSQGNSFLSFEVNQPVQVTVGHDPRITTKPIWLETWTATSEVVVTTDTTLELYHQNFGAGTVTLGGNKVSGIGASMYTVIIEPTN